MSADNFIEIVKFKRPDGQVVFRVLEATMSHETFAIVYAMSTKAQQRLYLEFSGPHAEREAMKMAERMDDACATEYGPSYRRLSGEPRTFQDLLDEASAEWHEVSDFVELTPEAYQALPNSWLLDAVA